MKTQFRFIDLFAGIGGFHSGLTMCGGECVMACEIDTVAKETYYKNYGIMPFDDICNISSASLPNYDLLCAGFPCQSFSNIGNKEGLDDPRGALIFEVIRLITESKPKSFLLENVKGLLTHDKGKTFTKVYDLLNACGYDVSYKVLEAKDFGVPQIRKRLFIVGIRKDLNINFEFPIPTGCEKKLSEILGGKTEREFAYTIRIGGRHSGIDNKFNWDCYKVDNEPRYLTIEECLQLQGFPKNFYLAGNQSLKYKQVGNAVPTVVVKAIGEQLCKYNIYNKNQTDSN